MKKTILVLALLASAHSQAAVFNFNGSINNHNDIVTTAFTLNSTATNVRVWTDSFKNGLNFDPVTAVWKKTGSEWALVGQNDDASNVGPNQTSFDSGLIFSQLSAGSYLFTVATFNNLANGTLLSQGFKFDKQTPIALANWTQPANSINMGRNWNLHLSGVDTAVAPVPEPETYALMGMGLLGLMAARRRKAKQA